MSETLAIIDYGSGNLKSAQKAFERAAHENEIPCEILVTNDAQTVRLADRIVLPGVGAFADCRAGLHEVPGMVDVLEERVIQNAVPFFGICVGMQLMAQKGLEKGVHSGFGWIEGAVTNIVPNDKSLKIPHMGWNTIDIVLDHPVMQNIPTGPTGLHAYFVHSYHLKTSNERQLIASTNYGGALSAIVGRDNLLGTQFHPEKSQKLGLTMITNFLRWKP